MTAIWPEPLVPMSEGWPLGVAEALLYCKRRGLLLGIISKNDETHVLRMLPQIFDGKLRIEDFAIHKINWEAKDANMRSILQAVNVLPENVLFIDDSPVERQLMRAAFPSMKIIGKYFQYTRHLLLFSPETQVPTLTQESANRTQMVQQQTLRETRRTQVSEAEFLASLQVSATLFEITDAQSGRCQRAVELINKTNQWNSTGERTDIVDLGRRLQAGQRLFGFSVQDQFTSYGDVGFVLVAGETVLQFVMSCRVVGLLIEMWVFGQLMRLTGVNELRVRFKSTGRNRPLQDYLGANFRCQGFYYVVSTDRLQLTPHIRDLQHGLQRR